MQAGYLRVLQLRAAGWSYADLRRRKVPESAIRRVQDIETGILKNRHDVNALRFVNIHIDKLEKDMMLSEI